MIPIILMTIIGITNALHCDKEFDYSESYGNGYDITCQGITKEHLYLLQNITINNEIKLNIDRSALKNVSSKLFGNVPNIRHLKVTNSTFTYPKGHSVFQILSKLEYLEIRDTDFEVYTYTFKGLDELQSLILANNSLEQVVPGSFSKLKNLKDLEITNNRIDDFADIPMCELKNLRSLNLSKNRIFDLKRQFFVCKLSNEGMALKLNGESVNINQKDYLTIKDYYLELTHFDVSYNRIKSIGDSLNYLKFITDLNLQGNLITRIRNADISALKDLERLYLNNNTLEAIEDEVLQSKENLEVLDVSHNKLTYLNLKSTSMLRYLNLGDNDLDLDIINNITRPKSLETLLFFKNRISDVPAGAFDRFHSLENLDLSDNSIRLGNHSFIGLRMLRNLRIRNASIEHLPEHVFKDLRKLERLDLSHNKLKTLINNETFNVLENLGVLNLSYNALEDFDYMVVKNLNNLHVLDIAGNKLKFVQYEQIMSNLRFLSVFNIRSNLLSCEFLQKTIKFLKTKRVSYTIAEKLDFEKENVGGIYCKSENAVSTGLKREDTSDTSDVLVDLSIFFLTVLVILIISIVMFKIYIYMKRRKYKADEFELIQD